jgi:hypothetical protein
VAAVKTSPSEPELTALWNHTHSHGEKISNLEKIAARLETGQDSLEGKIDTGFAALQADLQRSVKPPLNVIGVATLSIVILSGFGAVLTYMIGQTSIAMERETDLRFEAVKSSAVIATTALKQEIADTNRVIESMNQRMIIDDQREQQDMYDKGVLASKFKGLEQNFYHLDDHLHIKDRRNEDYRLRTKERLSVLETDAEIGRHKSN